MPGTYRTLTHLFQASKRQKVKVEEEIASESESASIQEKQQGTTRKWTEEQNLKFVIFVHYYQNIYASKRKRKLCKIFKSQSEFLERRTPTQCRSHFQKMMAKYKSIARMKKHYKSSFGIQEYNQELQDFKKKWEENHQPMQNIHPQLRETKEISIQTEPLPTQTTLCERCQGGEEREQLNFPQNFSYPFNTMNPLIFYTNMSQNDTSSINYLYWMPRNDQNQSS